jgi:tRNA modification GTPase
MATKSQNDIIAAVATPPGKSALAVVRVSGPGSIGLTAKIIPAMKDIGEEDSRRLLYDFAVDSDGNPIDEVTAIPYFPPKSYTAEEMVEIICHGGFASSRTILERLIECGARPAEPGEFTRRAFVNGRISLSQAEAVAAAIEAKSELALKAAARNLKGELFARIDSIRSNIRDLLTLIEAEIDFSEEEIDKTPAEGVKSVIEDQLRESKTILKSYDFGRGLNQGYRIAIVGRANVGKSSLLNAFLKRERAIVTEIPGTTRDTLTEWIDVEGFPILLTDTAGLRESADTVELLGQDRTKREIEDSDLVIFMVDGAAGITGEDRQTYTAIKDRSVLVVANKLDLGVPKGLNLEAEFPGKDIASISALNRPRGTEGLDRPQAADRRFQPRYGHSRHRTPAAGHAEGGRFPLASDPAIECRADVGGNSALPARGVGPPGRPGGRDHHRGYIERYFRAVLYREVKLGTSTSLRGSTTGGDEAIYAIIQGET